MPGADTSGWTWDEDVVDKKVFATGIGGGRRKGSKWTLPGEGTGDKKNHL